MPVHVERLLAECLKFLGFLSIVFDADLTYTAMCFLSCLNSDVTVIYCSYF